ncbi:hypothetical protein Tco_1430927 [Tanacetum coccineum]
MSGLENKFSVFLVCEDIVFGALLRKNITYKELVGYVRKKFSINHTFDISFHYEVGSSVVRIDDDNDVEFFGNEVYNSLATTSHKLFVKKGDDFDNKEHCMYVIGKKALDEGFEFKGTYKGTNLVLVGMDGNNQIVPIATGVSQGEIEESWTWHLMMNCKMKSDKLHTIYWKTCKAYTPEEFQRRVFDLRGFRPEAYKKLEEAGFETWSRSMCPADRYNYMTSNSAESINNLTGHVRKAPITQLMEWYRALLQKWPKNTDRINSQGEEPIQVRCSRCGVRGHNRTACHEPIANYQDSTQPRLKRLRQTRQESNIHVDLGGHSQEYEATYTNNYVRSQEYEATYTNNYVRSQEYEAAYTNIYVRSQEYEADYTNNYVSTQDESDLLGSDIWYQEPRVDSEFCDTLIQHVESVKKSIDERALYLNDEYIVMTRNYFLEYTRLDIPEFRDTLIQNMDYVKKSIEKRALHKMEYDSRVNERLMQTTEEKVDSSKALDASLVIIESNGTESQEQDTSSRSGNDAHVDDADIRPIDNEEPMAEVQTTADDNVSATGQQHTEQPEFNNEGKVDQNAEQCHDIRPLPAKLTDNMTTELSDQSLEFENICLKKTVAQFQKDFSRMEAHCVNLELKYQNQVLKEGQQGQFLNVKSNEAKVKNDIDAIETINIELEHKVAKLLKENETLKRHYKEMFDSIKTTRAKNIEHTTSLIANNDKFKAQLQEKGFAIAALKNELRKLTGNSVNTKFAKSSILGKLALQPRRNQSVVRQPTAFKSERPRFSKQRFASKVDVNNDLSKPVTTHYLPKERESAVAKPHHMIAPGSSRYSSNDMVHNHYLEEAKKKTQESSRNSEPSVMPSARSQSTTNGSKPKPRINNQKSRNWPASKSSCVTSVHPKRTVPITNI